MSVNPKYKVKVERCYRIVITDETDKEVWDDFWFGTKDQANEIGEDALTKIKNGVLLKCTARELLYDASKDMTCRIVDLPDDKFAVLVERNGEQCSSH